MQIQDLKRRFRWVRTIPDQRRSNKELPRRIRDDGWMDEADRIVFANSNVNTGAWPARRGRHAHEMTRMGGMLIGLTGP